jgi:hypothetical protein
MRNPWRRRAPALKHCPLCDRTLAPDAIGPRDGARHQRVDEGREALIDRCAVHGRAPFNAASRALLLNELSSRAKSA